MLKILISENCNFSRIAAEEFALLWKKVTGAELAVTTADDPESRFSFGHCFPCIGVFDIWRSHTDPKTVNDEKH